MATAIAIQEVEKRFGDHTVLNRISLSVEEGEIVAIMGSSGGGKTTLLKCISGLLTPEGGSIEVMGIDVKSRTEEARRKMGMVFQSAALFDFMSVRENILFGARRMHHLPLAEEAELVDRALRQVGLEDAGALMPSELSGGMRKRVGIARALALKPEVMLYDEPTTGLDPITAYTVDKLIVSVRQELGLTSLVVSHDVASVSRVADRIAFLDEGKLVFVGTVEEFGRDENSAIRELVVKSQAKSFSESV